MLCLALFVMIVSAGFVQRKPENAAVGTTSKAVGTTGKETQKFRVPPEAGAAFHEAAKSGDQAALLAIFGPEGRRFCSREIRSRTKTP